MFRGIQINIAVIGVGGVGRHFLSQLGTLSQKHPNLSLILLSRSNKTLTAPPSSPISILKWESALSSCTTPAFSTQQILSHLADPSISSSGKAILVDNTSSQAVADAYPSFLKKGISIVTPNKKAFSGSLPLFRAIYPEKAAPARGLIYHESSVGAGLPIISTLKDLIATGDEVQRIEGVFSGTMSYLFNNFAPADGDGGGKWSECVRQAKELGFTEPDARDDLNGVDVARKLVILARLVGLAIESVDSLPVESLIPKELESVESGEVFLERLGEFDGGMERVREEARRERKVVRYVGSIDVKAEKVRVGLEKFEKGHPIAGLKGSDNIVSFYTSRYGENPLVVQGAGAGGAVTAMGVTADLIKVIERIGGSGV